MKTMKESHEVSQEKTGQAATPLPHPESNPPPVNATASPMAWPYVLVWLLVAVGAAVCCYIFLSIIPGATLLSEVGVFSCAIVVSVGIAAGLILVLVYLMHQSLTASSHRRKEAASNRSPVADRAE